MVASLTNFPTSRTEREDPHGSESRVPTAPPGAASEPQAASDHRDDPYRHLLVLRFALLNLLGFALLAVAHLHGFVETVVTGDRTYISVVIFVVFLVGLVICAGKTWVTSRELNALRRFLAEPNAAPIPHIAALLDADAERRSNLTGALRMRLSHRISVVRHVASNLVLLGLVGTVVGFIIALSGVDPARASDVKAIAPMVSTLIEGMSTALYTTLVGALLNIWLMANHQLLAGGTVKLIAATVEAVESRA